MVNSPATASAQPQAFDGVAAGYDAAFTELPLGRWLRGMVWERLDRAFEPGQHVLELGCGTGEDAVHMAERGLHVTATDVSPGMLDVTSHKAASAGLADRVTVAPLDLTDFAAWTAQETDPFDGVVSNFGPLNCVEDRQALTGQLAGLLRPGGRVVVVVMGPVCPWEIGWHLLHAQPRTAFRRFRSGVTATVGEGTLRVWYPSARRLEREFSPYFRTLELAGIGTLLPPSGMASMADRAPRLFNTLASIDRRAAGTLPWRWLNDHYLMMLERR